MKHAIPPPALAFFLLSATHTAASFSDVTEAAAFIDDPDWTGIVWGDYDSDGYQDSLASPLRFIPF